MSFEGVDGTGKITQARRLAALLRGRGVEVVEVREPGGTAAGERVRSLVLDPDAPLAPRTEALLFAAARAQVVDEVIEPALARGAIVVADRFVDSSLVYQGLVRGLGSTRCAPSTTSPPGAPARPHGPAGARPGRRRARRAGSRPDRIEAEPASFQERVAVGYRRARGRRRRAVLRVDADGSQHEVARRVREALGV